MPGTNGGTGQPYYFVCAKCRTWRRAFMGTTRGMNLEATGRWRPRRDGRGGSRIGSKFVEYRCKDCGHVGWSKHKEAERMLAKAPPELVRPPLV